MEFYKRVLKLHHFRNLGRKSPTELLLNSSFENKHGGLVILVGENNVGKSNVLEALKSLMMRILNFVVKKIISNPMKKIPF